MSEESKDMSQRYCPICEQWMDAEMCPVDQVPTIRREILEEQSATIPTGTILGGRYEVQRLIGMGGMGAVYLGNQTNIHRRVAIKTLKKELMSNERLLKRFYREARAAAALDHPNIVKVYDFGLDADLGCPYIAMEYLEGRSLDALIEEKKQINEERAAQIMCSVARALTDAHSKGVVHRDLKPDNVHVQTLTDGTEHIKVLDFGIAKIRHPDGTPTEKLTGTGMALGTPYYMSPEQAMGKPADFRSDLYAIGCILYQLVSGRMPFDAEQPMAVLLKQLRDPAPPLPAKLCDGREPSAGFRNLYASLTAKKPEERPSSTLAVADQLKNCILQAQGKQTESGGFVFGANTLGPARDDGQEKRGLETLLSDSVAEKETLSFGAMQSNEASAAGSLSGSEAQLDAVLTRKRRTPMVIAAIVLFVGGVAAFVLSNVAADEETQQAEQRNATSKTAVAPSPSAKTFKYTITSKPSGADVWMEGRKIGTTPYSGVRSTDADKTSVVLKKIGHITAEQSLSIEQPKLIFALKPLGVKPPKTNPKAKSSTKTTQPKSNSEGGSRVKPRQGGPGKGVSVRTVRRGQSKGKSSVENTRRTKTKSVPRKGASRNGNRNEEPAMPTW